MAHVGKTKEVNEMGIDVINFFASCFEEYTKEEQRELLRNAII